MDSALQNAFLGQAQEFETYIFGDANIMQVSQE